MWAFFIIFSFSSFSLFVFLGFGALGLRWIWGCDGFAVRINELVDAEGADSQQVLMLQRDMHNLDCPHGIKTFATPPKTNDTIKRHDKKKKKEMLQDGLRYYKKNTFDI